MGTMLRGTTPVPNEFFDTRMALLSSSAIRVYLKIVRNTWGWRDRNGRVKQRDWISHSQFEKVGVSSRSVTKAIEELLGFGMIRVTDDHGNSLSDPVKRKQSKRLYYSPIAQNNAENAYNNEKNDQNNAGKNQGPKHFFPATKETLTKEISSAGTLQGTQRLTDGQRLNQIKEQEQNNQIFKRDGWLYQ
jgi:hypothetical protein